MASAPTVSPSMFWPLLRISFRFFGKSPRTPFPSVVLPVSIDRLAREASSSCLATQTPRRASRHFFRQAVHDQFSPLRVSPDLSGSLYAEEERPRAPSSLPNHDSSIGLNLTNQIQG